MKMECQDKWHDDPCQGEVDESYAYTPLCVKHWLARTEKVLRDLRSLTESHTCRHGNSIGSPSGVDLMCVTCEAT